MSKSKNAKKNKFIDFIDKFLGLSLSNVWLVFIVSEMNEQHENLRFLNQICTSSVTLLQKYKCFNINARAVAVKTPGGS